MKIETFRGLVREIGYGKKVVDSLYVLPSDAQPFSSELRAEIRRAELAANPQDSWNLLKFHLKEYSITFLSYPDFDSDPHPVLAHSTKINLNSGRVVRTDYTQRANPPILHRKETFLPSGDARIGTYAALTKQEEAADLYRDPSRIGLRLFWESLLRKKKLRYDGHTLVADQSHAVEVLTEEELDAPIERHRTAIKRYDLSRPVKLLMKHGLLQESQTFFDYGCGRGMDVEGLQSLGLEANGWDPAFQPDAQKLKAQVVNLGYVLNVIEKPPEREDALKQAFGLAEHVLCVSTLVAGEETSAHSRAYGDGYVTKSGTFQKFFEPGELEGLIERCLECEPVTLSFGICLAFKSVEEREVFLSNRTRRHVDWTEISTQLRFTQSSSREEQLVGRYELNRELLDSYWSAMLDFGRVPDADEFAASAEIRKACGGRGRAADLVIKYHGAELLAEARRVREEDVLSYLAMKHFERKFLQKHLPPRIKRDIKAFWGDYARAMKKAAELLFAAGDPGELHIAIESLDCGWYDAEEQHLTFHRSLLDQLPGILRVYVFCGLRRFGDLDEVDVIKIHLASRKLTLQRYDDFERKPLPELQLRIKIDLRKDFVTVFDHTSGEDRQLLFFKERLVGPDFEFGNDVVGFTKRLNKFGITAEMIGHGPSLARFDAFRAERGLTASLLKKR